MDQKSILKNSFKALIFDNRKLTKIRSKIRPGLTLFCVSLFIINLLGFCVLMTSCTQLETLKDNIVNKFSSTKDEENAVDVVEDFFNAMIDKNYEAAFVKVYNPGGERTLDDFENELINVTDIVSIEINWVEIKNNVAVVGIDLMDTYDDEDQLYKDIQVSLLRDEDGVTWKINFWQ